MSEKSVQFPRAVYISASGQEIKVGSRPNDPKADAPYDAACHNPRKAGGRLVCEDCPDVDVHFVRGGDSAGGDAIIAADGHFASNPGQADNHTAGCREKAEARSQRKQYD